MPSGSKLCLVGHKVGWLVVTEDTGERQGTHRVWRCTCTRCGNTSAKVTSSNLRQGKQKSCGCYKSEATADKNRTHGMAHLPEYRAWAGMKGRCYRVKSTGYKNYGGRGIAVCARWLDSFERFYEDMGPKPSRGHSLDRINNNGNYSPSNCRWATNSQQVSNRRPATSKTSKYKYVHFDPKNGKWKAQLSSLHSKRYIGSYSTEKGAYAAVIAALKKEEVSC